MLLSSNDAATRAAQRKREIQDMANGAARDCRCEIHAALVPDPVARHKPRLVSADKPFDRRLRRIRRDRAAGTFAGADYLYRLVVEEMLERLTWVKRDFKDALVIGVPDRLLVKALKERGLQVTGIDPGGIFGREAGIQADEDRLPFAAGSFDLILSVATLDTVNDLPGALLLIRRALRPDGLFLAVLPGAGSLPKLRSAMLAADSLGSGAAARIHPQIDVRAAGDLLGRAGFALPVVDKLEMVIRFPHLLALVSDLRAMAATNVLSSRPLLPVGRSGLEAAIADFAAAADPDGKTGETFELLYLTGWSPSPDQPRPAARGSAGRSLASVLGPKEPS